MAATDLFQDVRAQLLADKKKTAALTVLLCILIGVIGRALMPSPSPINAPATAAATPGVHPIVPVPEADLASPNPRTPPGPSIDGSHRTVSIELMPRDLARDVFSPSSWSLFPADAVPSSRSAASQPAAAFWGNVMRAAADYQALRHEERVTLARELAELHLQSTLTGLQPLAYVSGRLVREGDTVSGFEVVRIDDRRIVLARSGLTYDLTMR